MTTAAGVAARVLEAGRARCKTIEGTVAFYAVGRCSWVGARSRATVVRRLLATR